MKAIRQFVEVKNNSINVLLPASFNASRVEVIIFPSEKEENIPQWQKDTILERIDSINNNPELLINEKQFWKEIEDES